MISEWYLVLLGGFDVHAEAHPGLLQVSDGQQLVDFTF